MSEPTEQAAIPAPSAPPQTDWAALVMGVLLLLGATGLVGSAPLLAVLGLSAMSTLGASDVLSLLMLAAGSFALGMLLAPGAYLNARKFFNLPEPGFRLPRVTFPLATVLLFAAWIVSLVLGYGISTNSTLTMALLPLVNVAAIILPIGILLVLCLKGLPMPSPRRAWSVFGASAVLGPALAIFFELFAFLAFVIFFVLYASSTPGLDVIFRNVVEELQNESIALDFISQETVTLLLAPGTTLALLGLFSLAVPIIEEAFKVFLLWFYAGRLRSPVEGFILGALCGAAFALAENIGFASAGADDWLVNVFTRATAALPHIFNSGLMGWALAAFWKERNYLRLALAYLAATLVHGAWNALSVALALNSLSEFTAELPAVLETPIPALLTWGMLAIGLFVGLLFANRQMRKQAASEAAGDVGYNPPLST
jgi:RsiW-degrading membrane proteinase PrsW (M82 family)